MQSAHRGFRLTSATAARLSFVLGLGLTATVPWSVPSVLYAQQNAVRSDLSIQSDVLKALASYPDISSEQITANTSGGIVTLAGTASSDTAKNQAQVVAAAVDGVRSVVNNVSVSASAAADPSAAQDQQQEQEPVQQAQSNVPDQQAQQPAYSQQSQPQPGVNGNWGKAGPPPDVQNGQIPQPSQGNESQQPNTQSQGQQQANQYPMQDPGQDDGAQPQQQPPAYPQRPAYGAPNSQYPRQSYPNQNRAYAAPHLPSEPVTLPANTLFTVRTSEPLDSRTLRGGENFQVVLAQDLYSGPYLAIPRGAVLQGHVAGVKKPGALRGGAGFALQIVSLNITGQSYPVATDTFATDTGGKGGYTTANTVGGAAIGALIGAVAGGGPGAAIGAVAGGGVGLGASAATNGPRDVMPPETLLSFHLRAPLTVSPVSYAEVQRLQASVQPPIQRVARPRPPYGYGYPGPYGYPPPPPPPPYYYPYRYYYWR